ncbi:hypothetical protein [Zunongwangia sp. HRR-M8]|uniref:hypothetical protein n=1 Tax=Zunongwangia sp. HRR-M8 TaxID=3015170 RepID=UPI0022DE7B62|nr:hypothetical protein [Zunongwangia sp. HRR-M8]WBL23130.1 hypothetical protein PBT89_04030 [Zunongwangia sp. HRR-M8]
MEVVVQKINKVYIEKRRTLGLYHIVHQSDCPLIPNNSDFIEMSNLPEIDATIRKLKDKYDELEKCQVCFKNKE